MTTGKRMSKAQIFTELAEKTGLSKKDLQNVFTELFALIERELEPDGPGEIVLPDLMKVKVKHVESRPERKGIDPFTKQERVFPAKPASRRIKLTALKRLKEAVS